MTDRDVLRDEIERMCVIHGKTFDEKGKSITVLPSGPKFIFMTDGSIKTIIRGGKAFDSNGPRKYVTSTKVRAS
jgi:hypothetical protein